MACEPTLRIASLLMGGALALGFMQPAQAAGTAAGTNINNTASVDYQVSGINQTTVTSNTVTFVVDRKINLTVATDEAAAKTVTPGSAGNVLTFTVTNTGNDTFDFSASAAALTGTAARFGGTDNVNASAVNVYVETNGTAGYQAGADSATFIDNLAPDASKKVYVVATFAGGLNNADIASYHLLAEARDATTTGALTQDSGADVPGSVQNVFGDGAGSNDAARDAKYSDYADYKVSAANLAVAKSSAVISDPLNGATNPKPIPGAVIEYTITVSNGAGAAQATNLQVTDSLNTEITAGHVAFDANGYAGGKGIRVTAPNINGGVAKDLTNAGADDEGDFNVTGTNVVTVSGITLNANETAAVKFRVTVQ